MGWQVCERGVGGGRVQWQVCERAAVEGGSGGGRSNLIHTRRVSGMWVAMIVSVVCAQCV